MYSYEIKPSLQKILKKLFKKDKKLYERILGKIKEVMDSKNFEHYKNLRYDLKHLKRVHIGSFVLVFKYDKNSKVISFEDFGHHDKIYFN
jgi:YafQ family addiction module toxin component